MGLFRDLPTVSPDCSEAYHQLGDLDFQLESVRQQSLGGLDLSGGLWD